MSDDLGDLYGDLDGHEFNESFIALKESLELERKRNKELEKELQDAKRQISLLNEEKKMVETNMVTLYNTALQEIKRKSRI